MLGPEQPVILQLLEITPALGALDGVAMELDDCAFPLLAGRRADRRRRTPPSATSTSRCSSAPMPRKAGMERSDLLDANGGIFKRAGQGAVTTAQAATSRSSSSATRPTPTA